MFHLRYLPKYFGMKSGHASDWLPRLWEAGKAERCSDEARLALIHDGFGWWVHGSSYVALSTLTFISSVHGKNILLKKHWWSRLWERDSLTLPKLSWGKEFPYQLRHTGGLGTHGASENLRAVVTRPHLQIPQPPRAGAAVLVTQLWLKPTASTI